MVGLARWPEAHNASATSKAGVRALVQTVKSSFLRSKVVTTFLFSVSVNAPVRKKLSDKPSGAVIGTISPNGEWITDFLRNEMRAISTSGKADMPILKGRCRACGGALMAG